MRFLFFQEKFRSQFVRQRPGWLDKLPPFSSSSSLSNASSSGGGTPMRVSSSSLSSPATAGASAARLTLEKRNHFYLKKLQGLLISDTKVRASVSLS